MRILIAVGIVVAVFVCVVAFGLFSWLRQENP